MADIWIKPYHIIIALENKKCKVLKKFSSLGLNDLKVSDIRTSKTGIIKHLIELNNNQAKKIPEEVVKTSSKTKSKDKQSLWFESNGCEVCKTILSRGAFLISGRSDENQIIIYSFIASTFGAYQQIILDLEKSGHRVKILRKGVFEPKAGVLTEKQEKVFWLLLKGGYFDYPRKVSLQEFSDKIGPSPSSLSEMIRRGTRRLLEQYFEKKQRDSIF